MTANEKKVQEWCISKIGCGYVWGATGYTLTQSRLTQLIAQYPDYVSQSKNGKYIGVECYDCASFVRFAMKQIGISMVSGATSQVKKTAWAKFDTIDKMPRDKVCCLYRKNGSIYQHTGIYLGNGYVVDARGSNSGVIKTKFESYPWTHFGFPKGLYSSNEIETTTKNEVINVSYKGKVIADSGSTVRMRSAASSSANVLASVPLGEIVEVIGEVEGWYQIEYNGYSGYMMSKFIEKVQTEEGTYYVRIKCPTKEIAEQVAQLLRQATAD